MKRALIALVLTSMGGLIAPTLASAQTARYVSLSGNNANNGTASDSAHAWRTIAFGTANLPVAGTLHVAAGNYVPDGNVVISSSGSAGNIKTVISDTPQGALVTNFQLNGNFWTIDGFDISNQVEASDDNAASKGIWLHGSNDTVQNNYVHELCEEGIMDGPYTDTSASNNIVQNNRIWRAEMAGISIAGTNWIVSGNEIWDSQQQPHNAGGIYGTCLTSRSGQDADYIRIFGSGHDIKNNYLHDNVGGTTVNVNPHEDCIQGWGPGASNTGGASNVTFESNWCGYPAQWSLSGGPANNEIGSLEDWTGTLTIKNNVFHNMFGGMSIDWTAGSGTFAPIHFWNNTVDNLSQEVFSYTCSGSCTITDTQAINNQFLDVGSGGDSYLATFVNNLTGWTLSQNNQYARGNGAVGTYAGSYTGAVQNLHHDPVFVAPGTISGAAGSSHIVATALCDSTQNSTSISVCGNYHLQATSPDKTNGTNLSASGVTTDYYGVTRGTTPSIGGIQFALPSTGNSTVFAQ